MIPYNVTNFWHIIQGTILNSQQLTVDGKYVVIERCNPLVIRKLYEKNNKEQRKISVYCALTIHISRYFHAGGYAAGGTNHFDNSRQSCLSLLCP